jgi:hypothetical protein
MRLILLLPVALVACHRTPPAPTSALPSASARVATTAHCGATTARELYQRRDRGDLGGCAWNGDVLADADGAVAEVGLCGVTVLRPGLADDLGAAVGDDLRAVVRRYPPHTTLECTPDGDTSLCGLRYPDDSENPFVVYRLDAALPMRAIDAQALALLGDDRVIAYHAIATCE